MNRPLLAPLFYLLVLVPGWSESVRPPGVQVPPDAAPAPVPDYFMLTMTAPGCDPDEDCDDVGPKRVYRNWYLDQTGCNMGGLGVNWRDCEKEDPGDAEPVYDFSGVTLSERNARMKFKICHIGCGGAKWITDPSQGIGPPWFEEDEFKFDVDEDGRKVVSDRYWKRYEHFVEAACRYVRETYDVSIFSTGGNERDLVARETYQDFYPDWHFYYMAPIVHIHAAMKRAHPDNKLMIGSMCYTDRAHMGALYQAGAKGNFEILSIHNYGKTGVHLDMYQIMEAHYAMEEQGEGDIGIVLTEGWSCFPLPDRIDKDPILRRGARVYTPEDCEHYRQTVLDGWRNIMTPREGEYDPKWVIGAHYFVLDDHWGGRGWEKRAEVVRDENGKLKGFRLDGYWMPTSDYNWIKPFLRPWGLITIDAEPKGDIVFNFPPYLPKHRFEIAVKDPLPEMTVAAGHPYPLTVTFTNLEDTAMSDFRMDIIGRDDPARQVRYRRMAGGEVTVVEPGKTITRRYTAEYPASLVGEDPYRARGFADGHYTWNGRPYHTDAWMPKVRIAQPRTLKLGEGERTAPGPTGVARFKVVLSSAHGASLETNLYVEAPPEVRMQPVQRRVVVPPNGEVAAEFSALLNDRSKTGLYELKVIAAKGVDPLVVPVAFPKGESAEPEGFGLRNPSFEDVGADSGYAFWEGEKTNWIDNGEAKTLPGAGERAFGAATDWLEFDYTITQTVDLPAEAAGEKAKATVWYLGRGWDAGATGRDVEGFVTLVFGDEKGDEVARKESGAVAGSDGWKQISLLSAPIPTEAKSVRLELRLATHNPRGCRRGAIDMVSIELVP